MSEMDPSFMEKLAHVDTPPYIMDRSISPSRADLGVRKSQFVTLALSSRFGASQEPAHES